MKNKFLLIVLLAVSIFTNSCSTVPVTGRNQLSLIPASELMSMSFQQYDQFLTENKVLQNTSQSTQIKRIGNKIQKAVEQYFAEKNMSDHLEWLFMGV